MLTRITVGDTVDEAVFCFGVLERVCQVQLLAEAAAANGIPKTLIGKEEAEFTASTFQDKDLLVSIMPRVVFTIADKPSDVLVHERESYSLTRSESEATDEPVF